MSNEPLAYKLRPKSINDIIGQDHLLGQGQVLRTMIESGHLQSMIFWGPPGTGKTTLAYLMANVVGLPFKELSATSSGISDIRDVVRQAQENNTSVLLFIDEIHRFNKRQQDILLPHVESGLLILVGATTENPSFEVNRALLSRCKVFVFNQLNALSITKILKRAINLSDNPVQISIDNKLIEFIAEYSDGDARKALGSLETIIYNAPIIDNKVTVTKEIVSKCLGRKLVATDSEEHYNMISALHKSMRNSDPDAAIYWLARMLESGEDPLFIARRVLRAASEDVGLADPMAMVVCTSAYQACHFIGTPECNVHLTQAVVYVSLAPKSNSMEVSYNKAKDLVRSTINEPVPLHIRNVSTSLAKELGYGQGYMYAHSYKDKLTAMTCLPESIKNELIYQPTIQGKEKDFFERHKQIKLWKIKEMYCNERSNFI